MKVGLIDDQLTKNAKVKTPTIKSVKSSPLPTLQPDVLNQQESITGAPATEAPVSPSLPQMIATPQQVQPEPLPAIDPNPTPAPEPQQPVTTAQPQPNLDFFPVQTGYIGKQPDAPAIAPTAPIWQDVNNEPNSQGQFSVNVANTKLPSFSVQLPNDGSGAAVNGLNQTIEQFRKSAAAQDYATAQQADKLANTRTSLPNTPEADKRWYSAPIGILGDILFGTEQAKKQSEQGQFNPLTGSYGRAGAGIGGEVNYALNLIPSLFVGAVAEGSKVIANGIQSLGVSKASAENFARNGFLGFLPDKVPLPGTHLETTRVNGKDQITRRQNSLDISGAKPSNILHFDFNDASKRNFIGEALVGNPLTDVNDPVGATKYGRAFTRTQRKEGQDFTKDPVGLALQIGTYLFNPGEIPGDKLTSFAIHKLVSVFKKPVVEAAEKGGSIVLSRVQKAVEEETAKKVGNVSTSTGELQLTGSSPSQLLSPRLDYGEAHIHYPDNSNLLPSARPVISPRVYKGTTSIAEQKLPPVFSAGEIPDASYTPLLPPGTHSSVATSIGIGTPGLRVSLPGAITTRPLAQVVEALTNADPKLMEGFSGLTWDDFKAHISAKVPDISAYSAVGQDLTQIPLTRKGSIGGELALETQAPVNIPVPKPTKSIVTPERINKIRQIKETVELNSSAALRKIDNALAVRSSVQEKIDGYEAITRDALENVVKPAVEKRKAIVTDRLAEIRASGSKEEDIVALEKFMDSSELEINKINEFISSQSKQIEALKGNDLFIAELRYKKALDDLKKTRFTNDLLRGKLKVGEDVVGAKPKLYAATEDDLITASEELALHKQTISRPLDTLDSLFDDTVDFGRKTIDEPLHKLYTTEEIKRAALNNGTLKLQGSSPEIPLLNGARAEGITNLDEIANRAANEHNSIIQNNSTVSEQLPQSNILVKAPDTLYHGTALDNWTPPENLYANGSRGELGHGTYFTTDEEVAKDYALARTGENVSPNTLDYDLAPSVYKSSAKFDRTLDARKNLPKDYLDALLADLPTGVKEAAQELSRNSKRLSFVDTKALVEQAVAKSGAHPSEELLQQIDADVSKNLRKLGFDSVFDSKSNFLLSLDNSKVTQSTAFVNKLPHPNPIESAHARYNADSFAASSYDKHLTSDANLRDSAYKLLSETNKVADDHLAEVQQQLIQKIKPQPDSILPELPGKNTKPKSFTDAVEELTNDGDTCSL